MSNWPVDSRGVWIQYFSESSSNASLQDRLLFLDRDGVLIEERHYLHRAEDVCIYPAAIQLVKLANTYGWKVVVVTNQSGVGRGYYGWADFSKVNDHIINECRRYDCRLDGVIAVPYHKDGLGKFRVSDHPMRKPNPGMLIDAIQHFSSDPLQCIIVGDKESDLAAGKAAGLQRGVLVKTGYGTSEETASRQLNCERFSVSVLESLFDFSSDWLI